MKEVNFKLLIELSEEFEGADYPIEETIGVLAMDDVPMSKAVIQLGIVTGVLQPGYKNGWSEELLNE